MGKFLINFDQWGYCTSIDPITEETEIPELIRKRQGLEADEELTTAYGHWDIMEGVLEELEEGARIRNCEIDMRNGMSCKCGHHEFHF